MEFMEVPRIWREIPQNTGFRMEVKKFDGERDGGFVLLKYPGGSIPFDGTIEDLGEKLMERGFNEVALEKILSTFFGGIASEAAIPLDEVVEGFLELQRSEVGK